VDRRYESVQQTVPFLTNEPATSADRCREYGTRGTGYQVTFWQKLPRGASRESRVARRGSRVLALVGGDGYSAAMANSNVRSVTTGVLIALAVGALGLALLRPTSEIGIETGDISGMEEATASDPTITSATKEGGFRFLGITFSSPTYRAQVSFAAPPPCIDVLAGATSWPTGVDACGPHGGIEGEIFGTGRTADGNALVSVRFEIQPECFDVIAVGDTWGDAAAC